ncbi:MULTISPECIES: hypothetical protein [Pseudomonas]|uniref:hypothetical protein n=1 Tax=Pseudomonas TaxID=286 RepID=UPI00053EC363|nr:MULTISPECIES: hypothetical protein [Pseudomonas]MBG7512601.1 hypothetical protein [Pseudomonas aeruginosa]MBH4002534.1 hypothetical protein [Pseudomonas aeruginosa]MBH9508819.1 hypothetical protein [Pseudomonas aeruginosa]MBV6238110.1 hypothetical protein [Pseudomonas aeruginosa]MBV6298251.1 hypothetical protein [Pseudomonas aeruginosa]
MNDRTLLELAARAAGIDPVLAEPINFSTGVEYYWNPRDDDGDALRLAVKLRMEIDHNHPADERAWVSVRTQGERTCAVEEFDDESLRAAATRMAITRAAAEIGKSMGGGE